MGILKRVKNEGDFMELVEDMRMAQGRSINDVCVGVGITRIMYWRLRKGKSCVVLDFSIMFRFAKFLGFEFMVVKEDR